VPKPVQQTASADSARRNSVETFTFAAPWISNLCRRPVNPIPVLGERLEIYN